NFFFHISKILNLKWIYENNEEDEINLEGYTLPPYNTLEKINLYARRGELTNLEKVLKELKNDSNPNSNFVEVIERHLENFDFDSIVEFINSVWSHEI
ncbi:MAG: hypothetical protein KDK36_15405, partial [Leptospiraceae bacterium]|nr:hypothetical protein [Leptospiraceae bacterium]